MILKPNDKDVFHFEDRRGGRGGGSSIYFIFGMGKATNKAITQLGVSYHGREGVECLFFPSDSF